MIRLWSRLEKKSKGVSSSINVCMRFILKFLNKSIYVRSVTGNVTGHSLQDHIFAVMYVRVATGKTSSPRFVLRDDFGRSVH